MTVKLNSGYTIIKVKFGLLNDVVIVFT